jgi:hypothetical protein
LIYRGALTLVTLFWVIMNIALWRAEYGGHGPLGSAVPADLVWKKILTAPDSSSLSVFHHGTKIGFCHWQTSVAEELSRVKEADDPTDGMVKRVSGYKLQLEANLALDHASRLRFDSWLTMDSQRSWQELNCRLTLRPLTWELHSVAAQQTVTLKTEEGEASTERKLKFADLRNPAALAQEFGPQSLAALLAGIDLGTADAPVLPSVNWQARRDSVRIGHSSVRAYRLQTRFLDRYDIVIFVSRVGEILRLELPDQVLLVNDQLAGL